MTTTNNTILTIVFSILLTACNLKSEQKIDNDQLQITPTNNALEDRFSIVGDFNGDHVSDTIFESYISALTNQETHKEFDSQDFEKNLELIMKNKPITRLFSSITNVDTFIVTKDAQQIGVSHLSNLGDLNDDQSDEFGYLIDWVDYSNLNTFHIATLKENKFTELFGFTINEAVTFESDNLIDGKFLIKSIKPKTIEYKFYSDSATVETGQRTLD